MPAQPGEARVVSLVVHSITFTFPVLHRAGDWHISPLARWHILALGSRLEWNWIPQREHRVQGAQAQ